MLEPALTIETVTAENFAALGSLRRLWREYAEHLETVLGPEYVCLDDYEKEFDQLPGEYSPPNGALLLGLVQGDPAGSVGLRRILLADSTPAAEIRRIWVRPQFRGHGIARGLVRAAVDSARVAGYDSIYLSGYRARKNARSGQPLSLGRICGVSSLQPKSRPRNPFFL